METFAEKVMNFNKQLTFRGTLPEGISIMNPFEENEEIIPIATAFYQKFYNDCQPRHLILGINPGRFGAAVTGVPFTDSKRLRSECHIPYSGKETHEPSSVFIYEMISAFGGVAQFYKKFYISSVCPLGFTATNSKGNEVNYNYYDSKQLAAAVYDFIVSNIQQQIALGVCTDTCFCFGTGKNEQFINALNTEKKFFKRVIALEHPRFIMQYKAKSKQFYIDKYLSAFGLV